MTNQTAYDELTAVSVTGYTVTATDPLGNETVSYTGGEGVVYPFGTDGYTVTTDPLGVQTVNRTDYEGNAKITESVSAGVTNRTLRVQGGAVVEEEFKTDPVSGEALSRAARTETSWETDGCEAVTVSVSRNGGPWTTESVTRKDFLGRTVITERAGYGGSMLVTSNAFDAAGRLVFTRNHDGSAVAYAYDALGGRSATVKVGAGQTLSFDPLDFTLAGVAALDKYVIEETPSWKEESDLGLSAHGVPEVWWDCAASVTRLPGQGAVTTLISRVQLTGLSPACVARAVTTDADGITEIVSESPDAASASKTVTRLNVATGAFDASTLVAGIEVLRTNSLGVSSSYTFDGFARRTSEELRAGSRVLHGMTGYHDDGSTAFDLEVSGATTNVTAYSARQYLESPADAYSVTATDALGNQTVRYYHPSGDGKPYRVEGAAYPTATARDEEGRQSELRTWRDEAGEPDVTCWHYDDATGLLTNKVYADGKGPVYTYTADDRVASRTWARSVITTYTYDDTTNGDVHAVGYSDATPDVTNRYDLAGRLVSVIDGAGSRALSYDAKGRQTAETNSLAALTRQYDALGRDIGYDLDLPGFATNTFSVRYGYDGHGRLDRATSALGGATNDFAYAFLPGTAMVSGMAGTTGFGWTRGYEQGRNLIATVSNFWNTSTVSAFTYENDALGRRTLRLDCGTVVPPVISANAFCYNARSEVTNAAMGSANFSYSFDDIGNRKWAMADASLNTYVPNELNQYTCVTNDGIDLAVAYDLDGNMLTNGVWAYTWDAENRMTSAISNGVLIVNNAYDYQGRRNRKTVGSVTRHYIWDEWNIAAEIVIDSAANSTSIHYYTWGLDLSGSIQGAGGVGGLLAEVRDDGVFYVCSDANGNVTDYLNYNGTVRGHFEYSAFGEITSQSGDLADSFSHRFSTKPFDAETGISKYQRRDYIPPLGRWSSRDPIEENGGVLLYAFVQNAALNKWDLLGQLPWEGCCGGNKYNRMTKCCCCTGKVRTNSEEGSIYEKKAIKTGIRRCEISSTASARNGGSGWPHGWLEVDGFSAGFGPGLDGNGTVQIGDKREGGTCKDIKLSPCKYNISAVKQAIVRLSQAAASNPPRYRAPCYWCYTWRDDMIEQGMNAGKNKCGM